MEDQIEIVCRTCHGAQLPPELLRYGSRTGRHVCECADRDRPGEVALVPIPEVDVLDFDVALCLAHKAYRCTTCARGL